MTEKILEFGTKRDNEEFRDGGCAVVFDPQSQKYAIGRRTTPDGLIILFSGGVEPHEDMQIGVLRELREESGLHDYLHVELITEALTHYRHIAKNLNRVAHATCFLVILKSTDYLPTQLEEHEKFVLDWATPAEILANWNDRNKDKGCDHWIYFLNKAVARAQKLGYDLSEEARPQ